MVEARGNHISYIFAAQTFQCFAFNNPQLEQGVLDDDNLVEYQRPAPLVTDTEFYRQLLSAPTYVLTQGEIHKFNNEKRISTTAAEDEVAEDMKVMGFLLSVGTNTSH